MRTTLALVALAVALGCAPTRQDSRRLHYVDDELVHSDPVSPRAYEVYLRARLALEADPPRLDEAMDAIELALRLDRDDPELWTTRAEIELGAGKREDALASCRRALELRPGYERAEKLVARLEGTKAGTGHVAGTGK